MYVLWIVLRICACFTAGFNFEVYKNTAIMLPLFLRNRKVSKKCKFLINYLKIQNLNFFLVKTIFINKEVYWKPKFLKQKSWKKLIFRLLAWLTRKTLDNSNVWFLGTIFKTILLHRFWTISRCQMLHIDG